MRISDWSSDVCSSDLTANCGILPASDNPAGAPTVAQPTPYTRQYDFTDHSTNSPTTPQPGVHLDAEFNAVKLTTDQIRANLALIQRDDGKIANTSVHKDAFDAGALALIGGSTGWEPRGDWTASGPLYSVKDLVAFDGAT